MPYLQPWYCGNCGALIDVSATERAGVRFCGSCGAALSAPPGAAAPTTCDVRLDDVGPVRPAVVYALPYPLTIAMDLIKRAPINVLEDASPADAEALRQKLIAAGAKATVLEHGGAVPAEVTAPAVADPIVIERMAWFKGARVEARHDDGRVVASAACDAFPWSAVLSIPTGGTPAPVHLAISYEDWPPYRIHFNHPLTASRRFDPVLGDAPLLMPVWLKKYGITPDPGRGTLVLFAGRSEATSPAEAQAGVSFALSAPGVAVRYDVPSGLSAEATGTGEMGMAWAFDVPPGRLQVQASAAGAPWPTATVEIHPGAITEIDFWP